jgi:hypothetical protein
MDVCDTGGTISNMHSDPGYTLLHVLDLVLVVAAGAADPREHGAPA